VVNASQIIVELLVIAHGEDVDDKVCLQSAQPGLPVASNEHITGEERQVGAEQPPAIAPFALIEREKKGSAAVHELARQRLFGAWLGMQHPPVIAFLARFAVGEKIFRKEKRLKGQKRHARILCQRLGTTPMSTSA